MNSKWEESDELQINLNKKDRDPIRIVNITKKESLLISRDNYDNILDVYGNNFKKEIKRHCLEVSG